MIGCRPLSDEELATVSAVFSGEMEHRDRLLFWLGTTTGFRISELLSLHVGDLWRSGRVADSLRVRRRFSKGRKRSQTAYVAPLVRPFARRWLMDLWARYGQDGALPLFISRSGDRRAITRMQGHRVLVAAYRSAGLDGAPGELATHTMRKTYARTMYAHFGDIFAVQKALRHASPASTVAYLSFNDAEVAHAVDLKWPERPQETPNGPEGRIIAYTPKTPSEASDGSRGGSL